MKTLNLNEKKIILAIFRGFVLHVTLLFIDAPTIPERCISLSLNINETAWILLYSTRFRPFSMAFIYPEHCLSPDKRKVKTIVTKFAAFCYLIISDTCYQMLFCIVLYILLNFSHPQNTTRPTLLAEALKQYYLKKKGKKQNKEKKPYLPHLIFPSLLP